MSAIQKHARLEMITKIVRESGTDSPTMIRNELRKKGVNITQQSVHRHVQNIRAANASWGRGLTRTAWTEAQRQAYEDMSKILQKLMKKIDDAKAAGAALAANAYCNVYMHRKYLMENGIIMEAVADLERSVNGDSTGDMGEETKA